MLAGTAQGPLRGQRDHWEMQMLLGQRAVVLATAYICGLVSAPLKLFPQIRSPLSRWHFCSCWWPVSAVAGFWPNPKAVGMGFMGNGSDLGRSLIQPSSAMSLPQAGLGWARAMSDSICDILPPPPCLQALIPPVISHLRNSVLTLTLSPSACRCR